MEHVKPLSQFRNTLYIMLLGIEYETMHTNTALLATC